VATSEVDVAARPMRRHRACPNNRSAPIKSNQSGRKVLLGRFWWWTGSAGSWDVRSFPFELVEIRKPGQDYLPALGAVSLRRQASFMG
jgi:hypothetical protein